MDQRAGLRRVRNVIHVVADLLAALPTDGRGGPARPLASWVDAIRLARPVAAARGRKVHGGGGHGAILNSPGAARTRPPRFVRWFRGVSILRRHRATRRPSTG